MPTTITLQSIVLMRFFLAVATFFILGCTTNPPVSGPDAEQPLGVESLVVLPFEQIPQRDEIGTSVRCPICGAIFETGPISAGADRYMTEQLVGWVKVNTPYTLIAPGKAEGVRSRMLSEELSISERRLVVETGKRLQADAVIGGTIYRFRQRVGSALSVETPASVAFGIHLIRVADGRLMWVGHFDETQHSLSENLFKLATFVRRGGGWLTAEELASFGLRETMATFPLD